MQDPRTGQFNNDLLRSRKQPIQHLNNGPPYDQGQFGTTGAFDISRSQGIINQHQFHPQPNVPLQSHFSSHLYPSPAQQFGFMNMDPSQKLQLRQAWGPSNLNVRQFPPQQFNNNPSLIFPDQQMLFSKFTPSANPLLQHQPMQLRIPSQQFPQAANLAKDFQQDFKASSTSTINGKQRVNQPPDLSEPATQEDSSSDNNANGRNFNETANKAHVSQQHKSMRHNLSSQGQTAHHKKNFTQTNDNSNQRLAQNFQNTKPTRPIQKIEKQTTTLSTGKESDTAEQASIAKSESIISRQRYIGQESQIEDRLSSVPRPQPQHEKKSIKPQQKNSKQISSSENNQETKTTNILSVYDRAMKFYDLGRYDDSLELFQECLSIYSRNKLDDIEMMANIFLGMGIVYYAQGQEQAALEQYDRCIETLEDKFGKGYPGTVSALVNKGLILSNQGKYDESLRTFFTAQKLAENILGEDRLSLADVYHNIGVIYDKQGKLDYSIEFYGKSLRIREKLMDNSHPSLALTYENVAMVMKDQNKIKKAVEYQSKVILIRKKYMGPNTFDYALSLHNMGLIHLKEGKLDLAQPFLSKAYKLRLQALGPDHEITRISQQLLEDIGKRINDRKKKLSSLSAHTSLVTEK